MHNRFLTRDGGQNRARAVTAGLVIQSFAYVQNTEKVSNLDQRLCVVAHKQTVHIQKFN